MLPITPEAYKLGMPVRCTLSSLRGFRDLVSDSRNTFTRYFKAIYVIKLLPHILVFKELYKNLSRRGGIRTHSPHRERFYRPPQLANSAARLYYLAYKICNSCKNFFVFCNPKAGSFPAKEPFSFLSLTVCFVKLKVFKKIANNLD